MKSKILILIVSTLILTGCAPLYTQKTEAELTYDSIGRPVFKIYNSKAYQGLALEVIKTGDQVTTFRYSAEVVNSNTVASEVAKGNTALANAVSGLIGAAGKAALP